MGEKKYLNIPSQILEERERGREERVSEKEEKKLTEGDKKRTQSAEACTMASREVS